MARRAPPSSLSRKESCSWPRPFWSTSTINDPQTYERYKLLAPASIAAYRGKYLVRGGRSEIREWEWQPVTDMLLVEGFPGG